MFEYLQEPATVPDYAPEIEQKVKRRARQIRRRRSAAFLALPCLAALILSVVGVVSVIKPAHSRTRVAILGAEQQGGLHRSKSSRKSAVVTPPSDQLRTLLRNLRESIVSWVGGDLYVASLLLSNSSKSQLWRIDPSTGRVLAEAILPGELDSSQPPIVLLNGTMWVIAGVGAPTGQSQLFGLSPSTLALQHRLMLSVPALHLAGAGGSLWLATGTTLDRINAAASAIVERLHVLPEGISDVASNTAGTELFAAAGPSGTNSGNLLLRLDPYTGRITQRTLSPPESSTHIVSVSGRDVFVESGYGMNASLERLDTSTGSLYSMDRPGDDPRLIVSAGRVLVTSPVDLSRASTYCAVVSTGKKLSGIPSNASGDRANPVALVSGALFYVETEESGEDDLDRMSFSMCGT